MRCLLDFGQLGQYQAQSWSKPRRVVAKVEWHQGELYPRVGFLVTVRRDPAPDRPSARTTSGGLTGADREAGRSRGESPCAEIDQDGQSSPYWPASRVSAAPLTRDQLPGIPSRWPRIGRGAGFRVVVGLIWEMSAQLSSIGYRRSAGRSSPQARPAASTRNFYASFMPALTAAWRRWPSSILTQPIWGMLVKDRRLYNTWGRWKETYHATTQQPWNSSNKSGKHNA